MQETAPQLHPNEHWSLTETTEEDKAVLAKLLGEGATVFLAAEKIDLFVQKREKGTGKITIYYFSTNGRVVELIRRDSSPSKIEVSYLFVDDFLKKDAEGYLRNGQPSEFDESMQFIRFMMRFFNTFKKNAPLVFRTFGPDSDKRRQLVDQFVKNAKLTNVEY